MSKQVAQQRVSKTLRQLGLPRAHQDHGERKGREMTKYSLTVQDERCFQHIISATLPGVIDSSLAETYLHDRAMYLLFGQHPQS